MNAVLHLLHPPDEYLEVGMSPYSWKALARHHPHRHPTNPV